MKIIDVSASEGYEVAETTEAKNIAMDIIQDVIDHCFWLNDAEEPDDLKEMQDQDAISAADKIVEALIKAGWRPTA
jgi:hypothetical protein